MINHSDFLFERIHKVYLARAYACPVEQLKVDVIDSVDWIYSMTSEDVKYHLMNFSLFDDSAYPETVDFAMLLIVVFSGSLDLSYEMEYLLRHFFMGFQKDVDECVATDFDESDLRESFDLYCDFQNIRLKLMTTEELDLLNLVFKYCLDLGRENEAYRECADLAVLCNRLGIFYLSSRPESGLKSGNKFS